MMKTSSRLFLGRICCEFLKHVIVPIEKLVIGSWNLKITGAQSLSFTMFSSAQDDPYCEAVPQEFDHLSVSWWICVEFLKHMSVDIERLHWFFSYRKLHLLMHQLLSMQRYWQLLKVLFLGIYFLNSSQISVWVLQDLIGSWMEHFIGSFTICFVWPTGVSTTWRSCRTWRRRNSSGCFLVLVFWVLEKLGLECI